MPELTWFLTWLAIDAGYYLGDQLGLLLTGVNTCGCQGSWYLYMWPGFCQSKQRKPGGNSMAFSDSTLADKASHLLHSVLHKCIVKGSSELRVRDMDHTSWWRKCQRIYKLVNKGVVFCSNRILFTEMGYGPDMAHRL